MRAAAPLAQAFLAPAIALAQDETAGARLGSAVVATAHGHAMLLLDGTFGTGPPAATDAPARPRPRRARSSTAAPGSLNHRPRRDGRPPAPAHIVTAAQPPHTPATRVVITN